MRLATFLPPGSGDAVAGEVRGGEVIAFSDATTVRDRLASGDRAPAVGPSFALAAVTLLAPVPAPRAIFGIGLNYRKHVEETGATLPEVPIVFTKIPSAAVAPGGPVRCPEVVHRLDYEGELAIVMGAGGAIAGYAVADDVSARDLQRRERSGRGPRAPTRSAPTGPGSPQPTRFPTPRTSRCAPGSTASCARTLAPRTSSSASRNSCASSPRRSRSNRAT